MSAQLCASSFWICRSSFHASPLRGCSSMNTTSAFAPARSASSILLKKSVELDVLMLHRKVVDAAVGRRDPARHLARLDHALLQRMHEAAVRFGGDPAG